MSFRELGRMDGSMRHILGLDLGPVPPDAGVYETEDELFLELEVPGYDEEELAIELSDRVLTVRGTRTGKPGREFERRFELPSTVETEKLTASFEHGMLRLHVPKTGLPLPKTIPIATG